LRVKPVEGLAAILGTHELDEQRLRGDPGHRADGQGLALAFAVDGRQEQSPEVADDVRCLHGIEVTGRFVPGEDLGHQGEGQGMAAGEGEHARIRAPLHGAAAEKRAALVGREVLERDDARKGSPGDVRRPGTGRRLASGEDDDDPGGPRRKNGLAQPRIQDGQRFICVDQDDGAVRNSGTLSTVRTERPFQRGGEARARRLHVAAVQDDDGAAGFAGDARKLVEQRRLADAPRGRGCGAR
jgi:hypothetical protein